MGFDRVISKCPELRFFIHGKVIKSFFSNEKINSLSGSDASQLLQALGQFGGGIEFFVKRHLNRCQLAEVLTVGMVPPTLKNARGRNAGFGLHVLNKITQ